MTENKQAQMKRKHTERNSYNNISKSAKKHCNTLWLQS